MALDPRNPPPGDPPENANSRTLPEWMDRMGMHGQRIVLSLRPVGNGSLPRNPFVIGKTIEQSCGNIEAAHTEEKGTKYILKTRSAEQAKKLMKITALIDGTEVEIVPHETLNNSRCVVSCREVIEFEEDALLTELESQNVTGVRRITRLEGKKRINTPTLILTINGTVPPKYVSFGPLRVATRLFYPTPMICYKCYSYGHTTKKCQNEAVCRNCSQAHADECNRDAACKNCNGNHSPASKQCPIYAKEEKIIKMKVEGGISFGDARKEYAKLNASTAYSAVCKAQDRLENIRKDNEKDKEIRTLKEELKNLKQQASESRKDNEIERLRQELAQTKGLLEEVRRLYEEIKQSKHNDNQRPEQSKPNTLHILTPETKSPKTKKAKTVTEISSDDNHIALENKQSASTTETKKSKQAKRKTGRPRKTAEAKFDWKKATDENGDTSEMEI